MFLSMLTFNFGLIFGSFLAFLGLKWAVFGVGIWFKNCFGVYSYRLPTFVFIGKLISDWIVLFRTGGRTVGDFDYNTSTAKLGLGLGLSLAIM